MSLPGSQNASEAECYHYGDLNDLQNVSVYLPRPLQDKEPQTGYWVIYIHGGAWRDPEILAPTFDITRRLLCDGDSSIASEIAGYASINYRLSRHPNFPQNSISMYSKQYRMAEHPDHLADVMDALAFLQAKYLIGERYVLVGHSCGATLAFQTVMKHVSGAELLKGDIPQPLAIVGVSGIYDLRLLRDTHDHPAYQQFLQGAFGKAEDVWDGVSPAKVQSEGMVEGWSGGRLAVLASSKGDELVDPPQLQAMADMLEQWKAHGGPDTQREVLVMDDLEESHDDIWRNGVELAKVISSALVSLKRMNISSK